MLDKSKQPIEVTDHFSFEARSSMFDLEESRITVRGADAPELARALISAYLGTPAVKLPMRQGLQMEISYTNWRGETSVRRILPLSIWCGSTEWHPENQWFLKAHDYDKGEERDFALKDFGNHPTPQTSLEGSDALAKAAAQVLDWWHEWADHEPEEEETAAFKALEEALTATGFEYDGE